MRQTLPLDECFYHDYALEPFEIPEAVTSIGRQAFQDCYAFDSKLPASLSEIGEYAFSGSGITDVEIQENATIGNYVFQNCSNLTTVILPTTFYDERYYLLANCPNLRDVTFKSPTMLVHRYKNIFSGNTMSNITLHVPNYLKNDYKLDDYWYNCAVEGFSTADIQDWIVAQPLKMGAGQRFEGTPNVKVQGAGTWTLNGDDAMTLNNLETDFVNNYYGFVKDQTTQILSTCNNITIGGDFVHNYYTRGNSWYFITLPFDTKVGDISSGSSFVVRYYDGANRADNGTGGNWKNYAKDDVIPAGTGFIFQTSKDVWSKFKAQNNASKQYVLSNKEFVKALDEHPSDVAADKGWNLVGNPWQTYYNIHKLNFTAPITVWDYDKRNYAAYSIIDDDYAIKPLEAIFVQCPDEVNSISFPIDGRQLTDEIESQNGARALQPAERKLIDVVLTDGELQDQTRFVLNPQASVDYELNRDASKFFSMDASVPQIYTIEQGVQLAINERPQAEGTVVLGIRVARDGDYTITAGRNQFQNMVLVDNETGMETDLSNDSYTFTAAKGTTESRFVLRVGGTTVTGVQSVATKSQHTEQVYNLQGQRVSATAKGLYIVNGKKMIVK